MTQRVTEKQRANLVPLASRTPEERKKICQKGAMATNAIKNVKKSFRTLIEEMGEMKATETEKSIFKTLFPNVPPELITKNMMLVAAAYNQGIRGNIKAMNFLRDTKGEKPETTINGNIVSEKVFITPEQQKKVEEHIVEVLEDDGHGD